MPPGWPDMSDPTKAFNPEGETYIFVVWDDRSCARLRPKNDGSHGWDRPVSCWFSRREPRRRRSGGEAPPDLLIDMEVRMEKAISPSRHDDLKTMLNQRR